MVDELQQMVAHLGAKIEDRCGGLENCVEIAEQRAEERLVSLEMPSAEQEAGRVDLAEQMGVLKLEVNRVNWFLERANLEHQQRSPDIFGSSNAAGMSRYAFPSHPVEPFRDLSRSHEGGVIGDGQRAGQGRLPKLNFPVFLVMIPNCGVFVVRRILTCMELNHRCGFGWHQCIWRVLLRGGSSRLREDCVMQLGVSFVLGFMTGSAGINMKLSLGSCFILVRLHLCLSMWFLALVDQLAAYDSDLNPLYYAMRFVDGLKEEIKSVVMIQRPTNLDSACALALVQEEACDSRKKKDTGRFDSFHMSASRLVVSLFEPPKFDKPLGSSGRDDRRSSEFVRTESADDKLKALK
jgi:hypothetical protein